MQGLCRGRGGALLSSLRTMRMLVEWWFLSTVASGQALCTSWKGHHEQRYRNILGKRLSHSLLSSSLCLSHLTALWHTHCACFVSLLGRSRPLCDDYQVAWHRPECTSQAGGVMTPGWHCSPYVPWLPSSPLRCLHRHVCLVGTSP